MGVDVEPGCRGSQPCFAVVVLDADGSLVARYESVPIHRLIRLAWEHKPDILALDNVYELGGSEKGLVRVASMLPPSTEIVQVTRLPGGEYVDLRSLARLAGVDVGGGKLSPGRTAYIAALLALKGYGSRVRFVEEKTRILVSKSRRVRHGGSSNPRFQRRVRSAILRAVKTIRARLDRARLDYDLVFRKSSGGLESATFIVYAPREQLYGVVKPYEDADVKIEIRPVYSSHIVFDPTETQSGGRTRYIIVGVDPGVSTGLAAIDIDGRFVAALSRRGIDRGDIIAWIQGLGSPVLIAADVRPAPELVRKLAASLAVPLYEPPATMSVEEKRSLVEPYLKRVPQLAKEMDTHIRDALAAAVKAYKAYSAKLAQAESYASRIGIDIDIDHVKADVMRGVTIAEAVENAINRVLNGVEPESYLLRRVRHSQHRSEEKAEERNGCGKLLEELEALRARNKVLESKLRELRERLEALERDYRLAVLDYKSGLERDREVNKLSTSLQLLRSELEKAREENARLRALLERAKLAALEAAAGRLVPGLRIEDLSNEAVEEIKRLYNEHGRIVVVVERVNPVNWDRHGASLARGVLAVLVPSSALEARGCIEKHGVPVLPLEEYRVEDLGGFVLVENRVVVDAYARLDELRRESRREERGLSIEDLRRMLGEYRRKRAAVLLKNSGGEDSRS